MVTRRTKKATARAKAARKSKGAPELAFNHAIMYVADLPSSLQFYVDRLGLSVLDRYENVYARLRTSGDGTLALHVVEPGQQVASEGIRLYFEVRNLEKFCEKLQRAGISITAPPKMMPWGWKHAYLDDPNGHKSACTGPVRSVSRKRLWRAAPRLE